MGMQPKLRFKGFTDDWEKRRLRDISKISAGGDVNKDKLTKIGKYPVLANSLTNDGIIGYYEDYKVKAPAVTVTGRGDVGHAKARHIGYTPTVRLLSVQSDDFDVNFLENSINHTKIFIESTGVPQLTSPQLGSVYITFPSLKEQTIIGKFLRNLDNLIAVNQRKVDLLKRKKAGYLQKLFPKNGQNNPELRFKGYTDAWEKRRLGDVVNKVRSYSLSRDVECNKSTGYKYIHYGDIHTGVADIINKKSVLPNIKPNQYDTLSVNDLIVADASEDYQGIASPAVIQALPDENLVAGLHTIALRPQDTNATFLYYLLHTGNFKHFGYRAGTGLKVFGISWPNLSKFEFNLPSQKEQDKVVDLLRLLDNLVVVNQRKVDLLKREKKALLQKMFV